MRVVGFFFIFFVVCGRMWFRFCRGVFLNWNKKGCPQLLGHRSSTDSRSRGVLEDRAGQDRFLTLYTLVEIGLRPPDASASFFSFSNSSLVLNSSALRSTT
jgi:hypothetical protein